MIESRSKLQIQNPLLVFQLLNISLGRTQRHKAMNIITLLGGISKIRELFRSQFTNLTNLNRQSLKLLNRKIILFDIDHTTSNRITTIIMSQINTLDHTWTIEHRQLHINYL